MRPENKLYFLFLDKISNKHKINVFCFNHAGGSASSYYKLMKNVSPDICIIPIELAGHGARIDEEIETDWEQLITNCCEAIREIQISSKRQFVLMGCSLGALIAFRCALRLEELGMPANRLVICAHSAPDLPVPGYKSSMGIEKLPEEVKKLGGLSDELIASDEFQRFFLPIIFRDYQLHDSFVYNGEHLTTTPIDAFYGSKDIYFDKASLEEWNKVCTNDVRCTEIEGDHFFAYDSEEFLRKLESICHNLIGEI